MASNAVLQDRRSFAAANVHRTQLVIEKTLSHRPRVATESEDTSEVVDLRLRAGVQVHFKPDRITDLPDGLSSVVEKLRTLEVLGPGWDSYGGLPLSDAAVLPAVQLAIEGVKRCNEPDVLLRPNGGVGLRWVRENRELEVDIDPDGRCTAVYEDENGTEEVNEPSDASRIIPLVHRLCRLV